MMKLLHLSLLLLVLPTAEARSSFLPRAAHTKIGASTDNIINAIPRGGGGPFNADLAQKLFVGAYGVNAALCNVNPSLGHKLYGLPADDASERLMQTVGSVGVVHSLLLYLQLYQGMSFQKAIGWSVWPWLLTSFYQAVIAKSDSAIGFPSENHLVSGVINALVFLASQMQVTWATSLNQVYGYWGLVNSIPMLLFPEAVAKVWKVSLKTKKSTFMVQNLGFFLLAHSITVVMGANGTNGLSDTVGLSALSVALSLVGLMVTGQFDACGIDKGTSIPWILLLAAIANSLLGFV